ncbi:conjugative transfer protein MobI(A/C) [Halomonas sp. I5-271120]|uniref:conjugative transfer protein MobI(A/C) n=1 Tax=Halomonas sp. I5-271120 TaxID=3061632 RepID=UPI0027144DFC|nr:conjugative transfer protein MobI(A/C) [Halomonas sp. I5-271120]
MNQDETPPTGKGQHHGIVESMDRLRTMCREERRALIESGQKKDIGEDVDRESMDRTRESAISLAISILEMEYARALVEAKHEESIYNSEFRRSSSDDKPTGFYAPIVRPKKLPKYESVHDGFSISIEWRQYFKGGPEGAKKTMSKTITKRKDHTRYHLHLFKKASEWEKELIGMTEEQLSSIKDRMKRVSELKRKMIALMDVVRNG